MLFAAQQEAEGEVEGFLTAEEGVGGAVAVTELAGVGGKGGLLPRTGKGVPGVADEGAGIAALGTAEGAAVQAQVVAVVDELQPAVAVVPGQRGGIDAFGLEQLAHVVLRDEALEVERGDALGGGEGILIVVVAAGGGIDTTAVQVVEARGVVVAVEAGTVVVGVGVVDAAPHNVEAVYLPGEAETHGFGSRPTVVQLRIDN